MLIFVNKHQCQIWLANNELARNSVMLGMFGSLGFSCIALGQGLLNGIRILLAALGCKRTSNGKNLIHGNKKILMHFVIPYSVCT